MRKDKSLCMFRGGILLQGSEAKPTRSEKVEIGLIFDFRDWEKPQMYPLRYLEDFSSLGKSKGDPGSALAAGRGFASLPWASANVGGLNQLLVLDLHLYFGPNER